MFNPLMFQVTHVPACRLESVFSAFTFTYLSYYFAELTTLEDPFNDEASIWISKQLGDVDCRLLIRVTDSLKTLIQILRSVEVGMRVELIDDSFCQLQCSAFILHVLTGCPNTFEWT